MADALLRRAAPGAAVTHRGEPNVVVPLTAGPMASAPGWPVAPGRGDGSGWPGGPGPEPVTDDVRRAGPAGGEDGSLLAALGAAEQEVPVAPAADPAPRRAGWRRFFGGGHTSTISAA